MSAAELSHLNLGRFRKISAAFPSKKISRGQRSSETMDMTQLNMDSNLLKNKKLYNEDEPIKECDPKSEDPDVGILSCGASRYCRESKLSKLGGFCTPISAARALSGSISMSSRFCSNVSRHYNCNCTNFDQTSKSGVITCTYPFRCVGCSDYCFSGNLTATFAAGGNISTMYICDNITNPYEVNTCALFNYTDLSCVYTVNGVACNKCNRTYFDCTNIPHGLKGTNGKSYPLPILNELNATDYNATCAPSNAPSMPLHGNASGPAALYSRFCSNISRHYACDCSNFNETSKSGVITCTYPFRCVGCSDYCFSGNLTATFAPGGNISTMYICNNITNPYEVNTCALFNYTDLSCVYEINGVACNKCNYTYFDCTNIPHGLNGAFGKSYPLPVITKMNATDYNATCAPSNAPSMPPNGNKSAMPPSGNTMTPPNGNTPSMSPNVSRPSKAPVGASPTTTLNTSGTVSRNQGWQIGIMTFVGLGILFIGL